MEGVNRRWGLKAAATLLCLALAAAGCGSSSRSSDEESRPRTTLIAGAAKKPSLAVPSGPAPKDLVVKDLKTGFGVEARRGDELTTRFVAKFISGKPFESTWDPGRKPFSFELGADQSNPGWEKGLVGMRVGGRRELVVPPDMASRFTTLPPEDTIVYLVELVGVSPPELVDRREPKVAAPGGSPPHHLVVHRLIPGKGPLARDGDSLTVEYVGIHFDGSPFTNSWERPKPFHFQLGAGSLKANPGWEQGLRGMRVGERRELVIPPKLLYPAGAPSDAKPSETLVYVIDLMGITEKGYEP